MRRFDPDRYREGMAILGLPAHADEDAIRDAYREKAKKWHPDMYSTPAEKGVATKRIKRLNNARDYVLQHREAFNRHQPSVSQSEFESEASRDYGCDQNEYIRWLDVFPDHDVVDFLLIPIWIVWHFCFAIAVIPLLAIYKFDWDEWSERGRVAKLWMRVGPYWVLLVFPFLAENTAGEIWFWSAAAIVLGAELIAHLTGWWIQRSSRSDIEVARRYIESASDTS